MSQIDMLHIWKAAVENNIFDHRYRSVGTSILKVTQLWITKGIQTVSRHLLKTDGTTASILSKILVHLCFRPDSAAPKLIKNVSYLLNGSEKISQYHSNVLKNLLLKTFNNEIVSHETAFSVIAKVSISRPIIRVKYGFLVGVFEYW